MKNHKLFLTARYALATFAALFALAAVPLQIHAQNTRSFPITLWSSETGIDTDLAMFNEGDCQAGGNSIMHLFSLGNVNQQGYWPPQVVVPGCNPYNFSTIKAIVIDEPYDGAANASNCSANASTIQTTHGEIATFLQYIRQNAPGTRVWVNYSLPEAKYIETCVSQPANEQLNGPYVPANGNTYYIDVVSVDMDGGPASGFGFNTPLQGYPNSTMATFTEYLAEHPAYPGQQVAILPQSFLNGPYSSSADQTAASALASFFQYASFENQNCTLPLGQTGVTNYFDGCPVWVAAGYYYQFIPQGSSCAPYFASNYEGAIGENCLGYVHSSWIGELQKTLQDPVLGNVDSVGSSGTNFGVVSGWACDRNGPSGTLDLDIYIDGAYVASVATTLGTSNAPPQYECTNAGFTYTIPTKYQDGNSHTMNIYALDIYGVGTGHGSLLLPGQGSFTLIPPGAAQATGSVTVGGGPDNQTVIYVGAQNVPQTVWDSGTLTVTINTRSVAVTYGQNSSTSTLASALITAINTDSVASTYVTALPGTNGSIVALKAKKYGSGGDYSLSVNAVTNLQTIDGQKGFSSSSFTLQSSGSSLTNGTP